MNKHIVRRITQKINSESFEAYIPANLPPEPAINIEKIYPYLRRADLAIARLNDAIKYIPNISLFIYMYVRKEALLSSQIEGTQSSFSDLLLFEHEQKYQVSFEDVEEVSNYVKAINYGLDRLKNGFPLSLRLLKDMHAIVLSGSRGATKRPGEFRTWQNWIGGTKPSNAIFVPPPAEYLNTCLANLEKFLHDETLPILVKIAIAHVQFETIHPFLDGNGRLGRLLITLMLCNENLLNEPVLYFSLYLKQNKKLYYDLLQEVRHYGTWEVWIEFFLKGIQDAASHAYNQVIRINTLFKNDANRIEGSLGRARFSCLKILEYLKKLPQVSVQLTSQELGMSMPTARSCLNYMAHMNILEEISSKKRDKIYMYKKYLKILEEEKYLLIEAVEEGDIEKVKKLIAEGYDVNQVRILDGQTALHVAVWHYEDSLEMLELLLNAGADVNITADLNISGTGTPLIFAIRMGFFDVVKLLTRKITCYNTLEKLEMEAQLFKQPNKEKICNFLRDMIERHPDHY